MYADRLDGGGPERRQRRSRVHQPSARGTVAAAATPAAAADHRGHAVLTDRLRIDPRGRSGHVVGATATATGTLRGGTPKHCFCIMNDNVAGFRDRSVCKCFFFSFFFSIFFLIVIIRRLHRRRSPQSRNNHPPPSTSPTASRYRSLPFLPGVRAVSTPSVVVMAGTLPA